MRGLPGVWVQIKADPRDWYYVIGARRTANKETEYLVLHPTDHEATWHSQNDVTENTMQLLG